MLRTESFVYGNHKFVEVGETYYFGELWNGAGDGQGILESESIAMYDTETDDWRTVSFEVVHHTDDILQVEVKITGICS